MPTTTIATTETDVAFRRRVAKQLGLWWRRQGADINHVLTRFEKLEAEAVYSGPYPLAAPLALVSAVVSTQRDAAFRAGYAEAVRAALAPRIPPARVLINFHPIDPSLYFGPADRTPVKESR